MLEDPSSSVESLSHAHDAIAGGHAPCPMHSDVVALPTDHAVRRSGARAREETVLRQRSPKVLRH